MLPALLEDAGERGVSSAGLFVPAWGLMGAGEPLAAFAVAEPLAAATLLSAATGVLGGVGAFSTGLSGGGGMLVPSVREEKLKFNAGSSKRFAPAVLVVADMLDVWDVDDDETGSGSEGLPEMESSRKRGL